ncbi:hypothetical protein C8R48DRAFT_590841, partial [Suillus tomentosus]
IMKLLWHISHVHGELKMKMCSLASSFFGFQPSFSRDVIGQNRNLAESLKNGSAFAFKDWTSKTGLHKSKLLQDGINVMWFANQNNEGIVYPKYFDPMPVEVVALVITCVSCVCLMLKSMLALKVIIDRSSVVLMSGCKA